MALSSTRRIRARLLSAELPRIWDRFFATRYHDVDDDLTQPILWDQLARYSELNFRIASRLADDPQRPRWYAGSYFGQAFAPTQPKAPR